MEKLMSFHHANRFKIINCCCGHCGNIVGIDVFAEYFETYTNQYGEDVPKSKPNYSTGDCPFCGKPIIYSHGQQTAIPNTRMFDEVKHLPDDIEKLYNECRDAFSINAFTCCVTTARTMIAHIAVDKGAEGNLNFVKYVDYLVQNYLPASNSQPWVDKIRELGNVAVHELVLATKEQAEQSIKFITAILKNIYEFPKSI